MNIHEWFKVYAEQVKSDIQDDDDLIWVTQSRGDYITRVGMEESVKYLEPLIFVNSCSGAGHVVNIGFNPSEQKWYGWSHRAMYGFGIGSECKKGDNHYIPKNKNDFFEDIVRFWTDDHHLNVIGEHRVNGVYVEWEISQLVPNEKARGQITGCFNKYPERYGKGEWVAKTLHDARQMAIDFANNVS